MVQTRHTIVVLVNASYSKRASRSGQNNATTSNYSNKGTCILILCEVVSTLHEHYTACSMSQALAIWVADS